jgi:hypothetical protein
MCILRALRAWAELRKLARPAFAKDAGDGNKYSNPLSLRSEEGRVEREVSHVCIRRRAAFGEVLALYSCSGGMLWQIASLDSCSDGMLWQIASLDSCSRGMLWQSAD